MQGQAIDIRLGDVSLVDLRGAASLGSQSAFGLSPLRRQRDDRRKGAPCELSRGGREIPRINRGPAASGERNCCNVAPTALPCTRPRLAWCMHT
jgi:hypothetical protein